MDRIGYHLIWLAIGGLVGWSCIAALGWVAMRVRLAVLRARNRRVEQEVLLLREQNQERLAALVQAGGLERARVALARFEMFGEFPEGLEPSPPSQEEKHAYLV